MQIEGDQSYAIVIYHHIIDLFEVRLDKSRIRNYNKHVVRIYIF